MSVREQIKSFKGQTKEKFRRVFGASPAQSIHSLPDAPSVITPLPDSPTTSAPDPPSVSPTGVNDSWAGLRRFLQVLSRDSSVVRPLKLVMGELAGCITMHEDVAAARRDYQALKTELEALFDTLSAHFAIGVPPTMTGCMDNLCNAIERELDRISTKEERGTGRRHWEAKKDLDEVMECYRRIHGHVDIITLNADLATWRIADEQATESRLKALVPSLSAYYNSAEAAAVRRRECIPNTREQVLSDLDNWTHDSNQGSIYWLNGMAGTGKTTIANSLCAMLDKSHELGASFFCNRQLPECRSVKMILPTIAYQLARFSRPFRCALSRALERDPDMHARALPNQLEGLIVGPLCEVARTLPTDLVVVIDALDECEDGDRVEEILGLLLKHASNLPIKVFVSSRPEPQIRKKIGSMKSQLVLHELDDKIVKGDIEVYLRTELEDVSISDSQMSNLVERAGVLFIYAATVVRYIKAEEFRSGQQKRLNVVLGASPAASSKKDREIDALYGTVLAFAFDHPELEDSDKERMRLVLHTVICVQEPLTVDALAGLLDLEDGDLVRAALRPLWSVLHISGANSLVNTLHASFPDYMLNPHRSNEHSCEVIVHHGLLAERCFARVRNNERQFNICQLESSYVFDEDVSDLKDRVKRAIPLDLAYACQYWAMHLELGGPSESRVKQLDEYLSTELLLWIEVLNLRKQINVGPALIDKARRWCANQNGMSGTKDLVYDAWRFVTTFAANPVSRSTPHVYVSMLASWPSSRPIAGHYTRRTKQLVNVAGTAMEMRELAMLGVIRLGASVESIACSPDGMRIVSGSRDDKIQVWDAGTGQTVVGPLEGHTSVVSSVAFSPNGMRIVSGSWDNTLRVWDAQTGQEVVGPLEGHTERASSVAFSPDSMQIVSGSWDGTIRVWDAQTGQIMAEPLNGYIGEVHSVAFSPDGLRIVSASGDWTVRVWDVQTGQVVVGPLMEHNGLVFSVAFSPDGMRIASGSWDNTILVWDAQTGQVVVGPLEGHTKSVISVAYSPDGMRIVSGAWDNTLLVWDAQTGQAVVGPLKGHTDSITSVAFLPDNVRIVSGSMDGTIRVWDAQPGQVVAGPLEGHTDSVSSVAFSPDSMYIASGSWDKTIRVWDAQTGQMVLGPLQGHTGRVNSVGFSPDGMRIVSGSGDDTAQVWDAQTGHMVVKPLEGHTRQVNSVVFSPGGTQIVSGSWDDTIQVWDAQTGQIVLGPLIGHTDSVNSVAFLPGGMRIVSGSRDKTIRVWDAQSGQVVVGPLTGHAGSVFSVAFSPNGMQIVSGSDDKTIRVWDAQTGQMVVGPLEGHTSVVSSVAFSPNGMRIVSGSWDETLRVWEAQTGQAVVGPLEGHTRIVSSVAFSPDGMQIISGSWDKTIRVWDAQSRQLPVGPVQQHTDSIPLVMFSPDTTRFISASRNPPPQGVSYSRRLNQDGWAIDQQCRILLWVPHDLRDRLVVPPSTLMMSARGSVYLNFDHAAIGESWTECYSPAYL